MTVLQTVRVTADFGDARQAIDGAFARGEIPEVIVEDGVATVYAPQPYVAVDDGYSLIVLDTTGVYTGRELLDGGYESGLILTRDTVYSFDDDGRFQQTSLRDLNLFFPAIHFNAALVKSFIDLAQFFDRVNHDLLMERLSRIAPGPRVLEAMTQAYRRLGLAARHAAGLGAREAPIQVAPIRQVA